MYRLVNVPVNPAGRFGAPDTEPGPSGVGRSAEDELMVIPFPETVRAWAAETLTDNPLETSVAADGHRVAADGADTTPADAGRSLADQGSAKAGLTASISPPCAAGNRSGHAESGKHRNPKQ
jgi:hypothetical protein